MNGNMLLYLQYQNEYCNSLSIFIDILLKMLSCHLVSLLIANTYFEPQIPTPKSPLDLPLLSKVILIAACFLLCNLSIFDSLLLQSFTPLTDFQSLNLFLSLSSIHWLGCRYKLSLVRPRMILS